MTAQSAQSAVVAPRTTSTITPTPTQHEIDAFLTRPLPPMPWHHAMDGSPIDPQSFDPTSKTTSWP
jgi:hypothetical protein